LVTIKELKDQRNKLLQDAQKLALAGFNTESRSAFDKMIAETDVVEADIRRLEAIAATRPEPGIAAVDKKVEEKRAFENWIRTGERSPLLKQFEARDLGTVTGGSVAAGAQFVPQAFYPVLTEAKLAWGKLLEECNERETADGAPMKIALANDTGNLLAVLGEAVQVSEVDPGLGGSITQTDLLTTGVVKVTLNELQDSAFNIDGFVRDCFGKRYYRGLTSLVTNGSSSGNIASVVTSATLGTTGTGSNTSITYAEIVAMFAALDPAYIDNATWVFNSTTRGVLLAVTDTLGRPLYIPNPSTGAFDQLIGRPVVLDQYLPNPTSALYPLLFGDFQQGYLLRTVKPGLAIARLNERFMDTLEIGFIGYCRAGGISTDAGTHPILKYKMKT
jgi:HK97 family phage major capsid protein